MPAAIPQYVCSAITKLRDELRVVREETPSKAELRAVAQAYGDKFLAIARAEIALNGYRYAIWDSRAHQAARIAATQAFVHYCGQQLIGTLAVTPLQAANTALLSDQASSRDFLVPTAFELPVAMALLATGGLTIFDVAAALADPIRQPFSFYEPQKMLADKPLEEFVFHLASGGTINMKTNAMFEMWVIGRLIEEELVTLPIFDGNPLTAKAELWMTGYRQHYAAGRLHSETGSNYRFIHDRLLIGYARGLPAGSIARLTAKEVLDASVLSDARSYLDGRSLTAATRNTTFPEGVLPFLVGADQVPPDPSWFEFGPVLLGDPDDPTTNPYVPPPDLADVAHHQGILTAEEVLFEALTPVAANTTAQLWTRTKWTWRDKSRRAGIHVSSITYPRTRHRAEMFPGRPVLCLTTALTGSRYYLFSLSVGEQSNAGTTSYAPISREAFLSGAGPNGGFYDNYPNPQKEWLYQYDNVTMLLVNGASRVNAIFTHQDNGRQSGGNDDFDYAYADEIDDTEPNWLLARYGDVYMALWLSGTRTLSPYWARGHYDEIKGIFREMTRTNFGQVDGTVDSNGRGAGILAAYHRGQFPTLAALKSALLIHSSVTFDAASKTLSAVLPVARRDAPDAVEYRELELEHRAVVVEEGPELANLQNWIIRTGWSLNGGTITVTDYNGSNRVDNPINAVKGTTYRVRFDAVVTAGSFVVNVGGGQVNISRSGSYDLFLTSTGSHTDFRFTPVNRPLTAAISNISVFATGDRGRRRQRPLGGDWVEWTEPAATHHTLHGIENSFKRAELDFGFNSKPRILTSPSSDVPRFIGEIAVTTRPSFGVYCATGLVAGAWLELSRG